ncbi:MAG: ECF transporter S component [Clostridiales bacterium]|nr:ECF transporter S component [Clostridiales bacterium]
MNTNNSSKTFNTSQLVILGLMTAILLLMAYTPLGYLNIGPLAITFNVIPVAISAITLGPVGGAVTGSVFGLTSFLQCIGVGGTSAMGAILFSINPFLAFIQRFLPRFLDGLLLGYIFRGVRKAANTSIACFVTGFCSAFLNTLLFMSALVLLFGNTEYMQGLIGGKNILVFICGFVGVNAVCEMVSSTILTGAVGIALYKAHFVPAPAKSGRQKSCVH